LAQGPTHNLPTQLTSFIGRSAELRLADKLIRRPNVRLLTLTGPGGAGKTRFAIELALGALATFPAGTYFVGLSSLDCTEHIMPAIARAIGATDADRRTTPESLVNLLEDRGVLVLVDNFEHL